MTGDDRRHSLESASHSSRPAQKRDGPRRIGRTKGGLNAKRHAVCDHQGRPLLLTKGQVSDFNGAAERLRHEPFNYGLQLRPYQHHAIARIEKAIEEDKRNCLVAMATGTGKTACCIALVYRLLKTRRFRRGLFLVDRSALGNQASDAFTTTRMENLQTVADIFDLKGLDTVAPAPETRVHIATVQGMVKRLQHARDDATIPPVDQ